MRARRMAAGRADPNGGGFLRGGSPRNGSGAYVPSLKRLRWERTRKSNRVRETMKFMLAAEAKWTQPDGLPSWWPFWSDSLKSNVIESVRAARALAEYEHVVC